MVKPIHFPLSTTTPPTGIPYTSPSNTPYQYTSTTYHCPLACLTGLWLHRLVTTLHPAMGDL